MEWRSVVGRSSIVQIGIHGKAGCQFNIIITIFVSPAPFFIFFINRTERENVPNNVSARE
jgi:hypothetical protein